MIHIEEAMEWIYLLFKIEKGCRHANSGKTVSHAKAEKRMKNNCAEILENEIQKRIKKIKSGKATALQQWIYFPGLRQNTDDNSPFSG